MDRIEPVGTLDPEPYVLSYVKYNVFSHIIYKIAYDDPILLSDNYLYYHNTLNCQ
jgi:hypothetical protein